MKGEIENPFGEMPLLPHENGDKSVSELLLGKETVYLPAGKHEYETLLKSNGADGVVLLLKETDLRKHFSLPDHPDYNVASVWCTLVELYRTIDKEIYRMAPLAFEKQGLLLANLFWYGDACE